MELQLGLKITRTREDVSSSVDFRFSKDPFGPLVLSRETNSRFIIIIHLKGFKKENIEIEINREGNRITIGGRKPVEEMVLIRWMAWKREVELRAFRKVFLIPDVVDLDKIKARFDDDDATLTITMPKRVYGISGFKLEEEEEERVDSGDVSEVENREETTHIREEVEEENVVREESVEHSQIKRVGEIKEIKDRENQVSKGDEKGEVETQTENDNLEQIQQINEQDKILEFAEDETVDQQELADSNTESEHSSSLRKLPDIMEQESNEEVMEKQVSQVETKSDDVESRAFEEIEEQEPDEQLDRTSKSREMEKKTTDGGDDDDGLRKVQGIQEPERHNEESKIHEMVEGETGGPENKILKNKDAKEEVDGKMGEGFTPNIERTRVVGEYDTAETETIAEEFEPDKLSEKKEEKEENSKVRRQSENRSLIKLQETEEQHSKGQKRQEKTPEAEANIGNDTPKPVQERCEGKYKILENAQEETNNQREEYEENIVETGKKINDSGASKVQEIRQQELEEPARCDKESKTRELVKSKRNDEEKEEKNIAETETTKEQEPYTLNTLREEEKLQDITEKKRQFLKNGKLKEEEKTAEKETEFGDDDISRNVRDIDQRDSDAKEEVDAGFTPKVAETETKDKVDSDEVNEIHELVEKKAEENAKVRGQSEDSSLTKKLQETEEQQFHGQKGHNKQEKIKELVEEKTPEAETNIGDEIPKPVQEIEEPEVDTLEKCDENDIADTETKEQETYIPKILEEQEKIQELAEEKKNFSRKGEEEETAERKTKFGDDDTSRKDRDIEQQDSDAMKGQEEKYKTQELVLEEKASDGRKGIIALAEAIADKDKSRKVQEIDEQQSLEEGKRGNQFQKLIGGEISGHGEVRDVENEKKRTEADKRFRDSTREAQDVERNDSDVPGKYGKGDTIQELQEKRKTYENEQEEEREDELVNLKNQSEQDNVEDREKTQELVEDKIKDRKEEESETKTNDVIRKVQGIKEQVEEKGKDCKEEDSETKTDDVVRKVQGIKEQELYEPKGDHVSMIKELVAESEVEAECGGLSNVHGSEEQELHEPNIHKERDKTRIARREEPSGQEEEEKDKIAESMITTEKENSKNVQELRGKRPNKPDSHEKQYKTLEVVEAEYNDRKEEQKEEKIIVKTKLETEEDSSKKVQEIEKQECDGLKRSLVQHKKQETEEKEFTRAMEEKEIVDRRTKAKDGSLRNVQGDEDPELCKPSKRREEDKIQEIGKSGYREKVKKQDRDDILRSQEGEIPDLDEFERNSVETNIPQLVEEEKVNNISELEGEMQEGSSGKFHEFEERKSYEEQREATDPKDKHTGGGNVTAKQELKTEEGSSKKVQEIEKQEYDQLQRSKVEDKMQETEEKNKTREMEENEIVERRTETKDGSLGKIREGEDPELDRHKRHGEEDMIQELVKTEISDHREKVKKKDIVSSQETGNLDLGEPESHRKQRKISQSVEDEKGKGKMEGDCSGKFHEFQNQKSYEDWRQEESEEIENFVKENATDSEDKHRGGKGEHEEDRYEKVAQAKKKVEDEIHKEVRKNKEPESDKQEQYRKLDKLGGLQREGTSDRVQEKILVDDFTTDIQENEKEEESHESERHEKLDIVQDFVKDETGDQKDEAEEAAAVVANNEIDNLRKFQSIEEHKEQNNTPKRSDPEVKEEDEERVAEKETKEQEAHVQELKGKTENCKDDDGEGRRGENGKQRKTFEIKSDDRTVRNIREPKVQESNEKNDQEPGDKIEELERKETSNYEVKLETEDDSLRKGQELLRKESSNVSKRRPVEQEKIQQLKEVEKREDEEKTEVETKSNNGKSRKFEKVELEDNEELTKIRKPMEEKTNGPVKEKEGNENIAEEKMQDKVDSRIKDQEVRRQESYEILENGEHDKIPEPIVEGTKYHREEENGMTDKESEEKKRVANDVSSRKVEKYKAHESDGLEKHKKLSEIQENQSVEEKIQGHGEEEMNERGGYKTVLKTKSMEDSSRSQDVEEKGSEQTKRYAEQDNIQEPTAEEDGKEEHRITEGEQKEKAMRIMQVESKANDDSSQKNETEGHETTRWRGQNKKENNQEVVDTETSDQRREEKKEEVVKKAETVDEYDSSREIPEHEEEKPDKAETIIGEVEMSGKLAEEEINDDKEGNRAGAETKIRDGGFEEEGELAIVVRHREQDKKKSFVETDTSGKAKENKNQETKSRDDCSRKTREKEKQESHEQERNYEEQDKNLGPNYCRNVEDGKEDNETAEEEGPRVLKGVEKQESTKTVERNANRDNIHELVEGRMKNQEGENNKSMITEVLEKSEDHELKGPEGVLRKEDKSRELVQQGLTDNLRDEETAKTERESKDNESRKIHQIKEKETGEEERRKEQGRIKELVEDRTHYCRGKQIRENEFGDDGSSKKIQGIEKEKSIEPGRNEKRDEIQEPVESEDDEEELEVEFEESEEDWEAEVIQEMDSDEDNDKIRQIRRINLGFRLVGGSALFMSLIVIVIHFVRSKRKIRCYKF